MNTKRYGQPEPSAEPAVAAPDDRVGRTLQGRYLIKARLAAGGMGVIYEAERLQLGRPVAIKFLHAAIAAQESFRKRFDVEARAMSRLAHPNCVSVIDFGLDGASPYVVMDMVSGPTLRQLIEAGPVPPARALRIARQILAALAHAHEQGIVHRDIKPDNVVLTEAAGISDHVRILDFGLAKLLDGAQGLTSGFVLGTPAYMAPEQSGEGEVDARTDLYAVGLLLYEMLTGRKPFSAEEPGELMALHQKAPVPSLASVAPALPHVEKLDPLVARALAKQTAGRYASALAFAAAVDEVQAMLGADDLSAPRLPPPLTRKVPAPAPAPTIVDPTLMEVGPEPTLVDDKSGARTIVAPSGAPAASPQAAAIVTARRLWRTRPRLVAGGAARLPRPAALARPQAAHLG